MGRRIHNRSLSTQIADDLANLTTTYGTMFDTAKQLYHLSEKKTDRPNNQAITYIDGEPHVLHIYESKAKNQYFYPTKNDPVIDAINNNQIDIEELF